MGNVDKEEEEVCRLAGRVMMRWALGGEAVWKVDKEGGNWWARSHSASCQGATSEKEGKRPEPPNELPALCLLDQFTKTFFGISKKPGQFYVTF